MYLMGIDIGTSSAKAIITTLDGEVFTEAQMHYDIQEPQPGYRIQDADEVLKAILNTMSTALQEVGDKSTVLGISFSSAMHSLLAVDINNKPLTPLLLWADTRSIKQAAYIKQNLLATDLYQTCGVPIHPMTPLCKIMWLRENEPSIFNAASKFISIKEYLFYHLVGEYVVDHSIASATGMFNIRSFSWHQPALDLAGITTDRLSTPVPVIQSYTISPQAEKLNLGILPNTPLFIGSSDGCLANIGSGVKNTELIALTISTSMAVRVTCKEPLVDETQSIFNYAVQKGMYVSGGGSNNGSLLLNWMGESLLDNVAYQAPEQFIAKALTAPPGCEGLIFLPYLLGERAPVWDANATGILTGFQFQHQQQHLMRSLIEGITMNAVVIIERLVKLTGEVKGIKASGGFTNAHEWVQILADISNLPVTIDNTVDASAMGAVILAGYALGVYPKLEIPKTAGTHTEIFYPNTELHAVYAKNFEIFRKLYANNHQ